jgi:hypothetical protein
MKPNFSIETTMVLGIKRVWFLGSHPAGKLPLRVAVCETLSAASRNVAMLGSHMEHAQFSVST